MSVVVPAIEVVEFFQDADSWGWSIRALFYTHHGAGHVGSVPRWGTLDVLTGTENGRGFPAEPGEPPAKRLRTEAEVVTEHWFLIDWHANEEKAMAMWAEMQSRSW